MTRTRIVTVAVVGLLAAGALAAAPAQAGPVRLVAAPAAEGLCLDLSALNLPSICIGQLLP